MGPGDNSIPAEVPPAPAGACRGCGGDIWHLPPSARYCPHCGRQLALLTAEDIRRESVRWALSLRKLRWLWPHWHPRMDAEYTGDPDRSKVVTGYGNALFNLGWRYERGWGVRRNLPEALRCYSKSSKLGNADAT